MTGEPFLIFVLVLTLFYAGMYLFFEFISSPKRDHEVVADTNDLAFALLPSGLLFYLLLSLNVSSFTLILGCALCTLLTLKILEYRAEERYQFVNNPWSYISRRRKKHD